jgi:hypothetical protein
MLGRLRCVGLFEALLIGMAAWDGEDAVTRNETDSA